MSKVSEKACDAAAEVADTVRMQIEKQRKLIRIANFLKYYDGYKR